MRPKSWSILGVSALSLLFLGGYVVVASTTSGPQAASGAAGPALQAVVGDGVMAHSEQPAYCAAVIVPGATASLPPQTALICNNLCTSNAQCDQACCQPEGDNVCPSGPSPKRCHCQ
jgi:hypothetical protein